MKNITKLIITANFDGACDGSSSKGIIGFGFHVNIDGKEIFSEAGFPAFMGTSNVSEYTALAALMTWLGEDGNLLKLRNEYKVKYKRRIKLILIGDSQVIIKQMTGEYRVTTDNLRLMNKLCKSLLELMPLKTDVEFKWVRRQFNQRADDLSKEGLKKSLQYWNNVQEVPDD